MEQKERRENGKGNGKESTSRNGYELERIWKGKYEQKWKGTEKIKKKRNIIGSKMARNPTERNG